MRFRRLHIEKFGSFTDFVREFKKSPAKDNSANAATDLHVIFGPNEAGKSGFLRTIRALLYGIPPSSPDDFLHKYSAMRISSEIENKLGRKLSFTRRKGNKDTLLGADGKPLDNDILDDYLGQADLGFFNRVCGLGAVELTAGTEDLQKGEGELGKALFGATVGGTRLKNALASLEAQATGLYRARGASVIAAQLLERKNTLLELNKTMVLPSDITNAEKMIVELTTQKESLNVEIAQLRQQQARIEQYQRAYTTLEELKASEQILLEYVNTPDVDDGFVARVRLANQNLNNQKSVLAKTKLDYEDTQNKLEQFDQPTPILDDEDQIQDAYRNLNAVLKNQQELEEAERTRSTLEHSIQGQLAKLNIADVPIESLGRFRLNTADKLQFREATESYDGSVIISKEFSADVERIKQTLAKLEAKQPDPIGTDVEQLRLLLPKAREAKRIADTVKVDTEVVTKLKQTLSSKHANLPSAPTSLDKAAELRLPRAETISEFQETFNTLKTKLEQCQLDGDAARELLSATQFELQGILDKHGLLASVDELQAVREERDSLWSLVLANWKGGAVEQSLADVPLADAYPQLVVKADKIADVLRQDADVAAQVVSKKSEQTKYEQQLSRLDTKQVALQKQYEDELRKWRKLWAATNVDAGTPREMAAWRAEWVSFCESFANYRALTDSLSSLKLQIDESTTQLQTALQVDGHADLDTLIETCAARITEADERAGAEKVRLSQIAESKQALEHAMQDMHLAQTAEERAATQWQSRCAALDLPIDHSTRIAAELLEAREMLLADFAAWSKNQNVSAALTSAVSEFESKAIALASKYGIESETLSGRVEKLHEALEQAKTYRSNKQVLSERIKELESSIANEEKLVQAETVLLSGLVKQLELPSMSGLESALDEIERKAAPLNQQRELHRRLLTLAGGEDVVVFRAEVEKRDAAELDAEQSGLEQQVNQLYARRDDILKELTTTQASLDTLSKESSKAVGLQQRAESLTAAIESNALRYIRLLMSIDFLNEQIASYRKQSQGPLLQHASENFKQLTSDEFTGLSVAYNDKDERMLVGVRKSGELVGIKAMSDGTTDQLYLALRLAALDQHMSSHEPLPLIIDDLLITFDDDRAAQMLKLLLEFSTKTQIILLTHHQHIVDLCKSTLNKDQVQFHSLGDD